MNEKLKVVKPFGHLYTMNEVYFLLKPEPIVGDSWEGDNCYRFLVTPTIPEAVEQKDNKVYNVYGYARHVVTNSFAIEYMDDIFEICIINEIGYTIEPRLKETIENDKENIFPY